MRDLTMLCKNIAILGSIGVGKTTLMSELEKRLRSKSDNVVVQPEPSVTIPFVNEVLKKFYNDNSAWSFPLQLSISAAQEAYMQELRESEYDYALFDAPYSSDIYGYSHSKRGRMRIEDFHALVAIGRPFKFDVVIQICEDKETTIKRISSRNKRVEEGDMDPDKKDVAIDDFSYLDSHIEDFTEYFPIYVSKFKAYNPDAKIIKVRHIPELGSPEYEKFLDNILEEIN